MKKLLVLPFLALLLAGCSQQPQPTYTYTSSQPAQPVQAEINAVQDGNQSVVSRACLDNQNRVVDDRYCDAAWIAQQQAIAQQNHDDAMLRNLLIYHAMFGGSYNNGIYIGGVSTLPPGYIYRPYVIYAHDYARRPVIHKTVVVNNITNVSNTTTVKKIDNRTTTAAPQQAKTPVQASVQITKPAVVRTGGSAPPPSWSKPSSSFKSSSSSSRRK